MIGERGARERSLGSAPEVTQECQLGIYKPPHVWLA
jgi:hypothetical protein